MVRLSDLTNQGNSDADCLRVALSVICFANASSPEGRAEKPVRISCPSAQSKLVSPSGRDVAQRQRGMESAGMAFQICPDTSFFVLRAKQKQSILRYSVSWWEVVDSLFCGKATPVATCIQHVAKSRLSNPLLLFSTLRVKQKQSIFRYSVSWWEVVDSNHRSR